MQKRHELCLYDNGKKIECEKLSFCLRRHDRDFSAFILISFKWQPYPWYCHAIRGDYAFYVFQFPESHCCQP